MDSSILYLIPSVLASGTANEVISPQIREIIPQIKVFWVENIRTARRFISSLSLNIDISHLQFEVLDKNTSAPDILLLFQKYPNQNIGVLSEAGCPGVADPGAKAVARAHELGIRVFPLVGPSSILLALMASGLSGQSFVFYGYLPIDKTERVKKIKWIEKQSQKQNQTQIFMETPYRNIQLFEDILKCTQSETKLCVACNITSKDELINTKKIREWKKNKPQIHKKPTIFLLQSD